MRPLVIRAVFLCVFAGFLVPALAAQREAASAGRAPATAGLDAKRLDDIPPLVDAAIAEKKLPGAVVLVGRGDRVIYQKALGNRSLEPVKDP